MSETIGFIGLGNLGLPLASNLLHAGYALRVYNRTASKADSLVARGAHQATRPADAVTTGGIVATIVWDDAALESVVTSDGFLEQLGSGGIHLSMSTVLPETSKKLGLSLDEIHDVIDLYFTDPSGRQPKQKVLAILRQHLAEADQKIGALQQFRADLQGHIERFERWLGE